MTHRVGIVMSGLVAFATLFAVFAVDAVASGASAQGLAGSWRGGGRVTFGSGDSERATCRASFRRVASSTYAMDAVCATTSARVQQSARVQLVSGGAYAGRFYNAEFDISGTIRITVRGSRLNASLRGANSSAFLSLRR